MSREPASFRLDPIVRLSELQSSSESAPTPANVVEAKPPARPFPWKLWALRLLTPALLLAALFGGHQLWSWQAKRQFMKVVDGLRKKGEVVSIAQLRTVPIPDESNGAFDLRAAAEASVPDGDTWQSMFSGSLFVLPLTPRELEIVRPVVAANEQVHVNINAAMSKPAIQWVPLMQNRGQFSPFGSRGMGLFRSRSLSQLLYASALVAHQDGDDQAAVTRIGELLFMARANAGRPNLPAQNGAFWIYDYAFRAINEILPDLRVGDAPGNASPRQIRELLARMSNERELLDPLLYCLRSERARYIDIVLLGPSGAREMAGPDVVLWGNDPLPMPWVYSDIERVITRPVQFGRAQQAIERLNLGIDSLTLPSLRDFLDANDSTNAVDDAGDDTGTDNKNLAPLASTLDRIGRDYFATLAKRRCTTVALAAAVFRAERGRWPKEDLSELTPDYLTHFPTDPLSTTGEKIVYIADPDRPRVYSVGDDGIDDGGWPAEFSPNRSENAAMVDWVVDLVRQPRVSFAATRPG